MVMKADGFRIWKTSVMMSEQLDKIYQSNSDNLDLECRNCRPIQNQVRQKKKKRRRADIAQSGNGIATAAAIGLTEEVWETMKKIACKCVKEIEEDEENKKDSKKSGGIRVGFVFKKKKKVSDLLRLVWMTFRARVAILRILEHICRFPYFASQWKLLPSVIILVAASFIIKSNNVVVFDNWIGHSKIAQSFGKASNELPQCIGGDAGPCWVDTLKTVQEVDRSLFIKNRIALIREAGTCYWQGRHSRNSMKKFNYFIYIFKSAQIEMEVYHIQMDKSLMFLLPLMLQRISSSNSNSDSSDNSNSIIDGCSTLR
ncbi:hypothetical protein RFI_31446 [Reticulomyxa filosa]|uniref:Uncharacterized protein n=1 Tax=Reticulomyxa filosa TaxID=46433 RepID=X6LWG6_RETFI|nr:hypothetical protein RFI_31446 [Reticulomyxa filosa]|eukprot:ETO05949.1 hypothetical protein RFI_31446 [Reticulomyxa filosa]